MARALIGFMGAGKTTVARYLDPDFVDLDREIEQVLQITISQYFREKGEAAFRQLETQHLARWLASDKLIATGGGIVLSPDNRRLLRACDEVIYLRADFDTLYDRLQKDPHNQRPLFDKSSKADLKELYETRQALYEVVADCTIDVADKTPQEVAVLIKRSCND